MYDQNGMKLFIVAILMGAVILPSCKKQIIYQQGQFGYDEELLSQYDPTLVKLCNADSTACLLISPAYQGRVMTSTALGKAGTSFGWLNYGLIQADTIQNQIHIIGGEERLWFGPEGGPFSIYFPPGKEQLFTHWQVPSLIDTDPFNVATKAKNSLKVGKEFILENYSGFEFRGSISRQITLLNRREIEHLLQVETPPDVYGVGYQSKNILYNKSDQPWISESGLLSIWLLSMLNSSDDNYVMIPFEEGDSLVGKPIFTDDYFNALPKESFRIKDNILFLKADGKMRYKIGISPERSTPLMASYDWQAKILTFTLFEPIDRDAKYVNSRWGIDQQPYRGDVVNFYNDGPLEGGGQLGPFYELESSSPGAELVPGDSITHIQSSFHFEGDGSGLNQLLSGVLGIRIVDMLELWQEN